MSREGNGWEYVDGAARYAPTVEGAIAELTYDKYGQDYEESVVKLMDIVRAAQRDAAEKIASSEPDVPEGFTLKEAWLEAWKAGRDDAAALIFPAYPEEGE
ncbi:hypothetical protein [Streptomyces sp. H34-S4]|uniref:hypothetical protein n=1 Tax=Streptomyces sp. H34-S4 TaxID=2996463 RepID=UPI00226FCB6B|nr:hypothetical protein [Streptomyces sp. H34-S4]MCY0933663.1 hypothetical protein [Streptomyces sp. H34-S4]